MLRGCLVCVICNSKSFHFLIFKLCIIIAHTLKMCTSYFVHIWSIFSCFWGVLNFDIFPSAALLGCLVYVICNSKSFLFFLFKLCIRIVHTLKMCTYYFMHISEIFFSFLRGVELRHFFPSEMLRGCLVCVICNSNRFHSLIFKLCKMIAHTLKMCTFYFEHIWSISSCILRGVDGVSLAGW